MMNTNSNIIISVIIPTYKPQDYILECLQSLDNQCFDKKMYEVIIVLNGEREPYYSLIDNFLVRCGFIYKLFYTDIAGVSNARNIGIEQSNGSYLTFIDDDDMVSENYLQGLYDIAQNGVVPLSYLKAFVGDISNTKNYHITDTYKKMIGKKLTPFNVRAYFDTSCLKLIPREIVGKYRFNRKFQNHEDLLFMFAISTKKMKLQFTDRTAVYYRRIRDNSLTTRSVSFSYIIKNHLTMIFILIMTYLKAPTKYDFLFFISRLIRFSRGIFTCFFKQKNK